MDATLLLLAAALLVADVALVVTLLPRLVVRRITRWLSTPAGQAWVLQVIKALTPLAGAALAGAVVPPPGTSEAASVLGKRGADARAALQFKTQLADIAIGQVFPAWAMVPGDVKRSVLQTAIKNPSIAAPIISNLAKQSGFDVSPDKVHAFLGGGSAVVEVEA